MAELLNRVYKLDPPLKKATPFVWWDRTTRPRNDRLTTSMPEPVVLIGNKKTPVFNEDDILDWYSYWKQIPRPR
jgi:hypothetical protein